MPYANRRRNFRRKRNTTLRSRNIYQRKSATAQSSQIAALNRRVSRVSRTLRPNIKTLYSTPYNMSFTNEALTNVYNAFWISAPVPGTTDENTTGNRIRYRNISLRMNASYTNSSATGVHDNSDSTVMYRVIVIQSKDSMTMSSTPTVSIPSYSSLQVARDCLSPAWGNSDYDLNTCKPFNVGVTQSYKILYDRTFRLDYQISAKNHKISVKPKYPLRFNNKQLGSPSIPEIVGSVCVIITTSNLKWDTAFKETLNITSMTKSAYTDE